MVRISVVVMVALLAGCQSAPSAQVSTPQVPVVANAPQGSMAALLNAQRAGQGRGAVVEDAALSRAARAYATDMAQNGYFSHTGRDGSSFVDRARGAGYACAASENIAEGQRSEAEVMEAWMNSSGHRRNILSGDAREFGIGRSGNVWVLMFGRGC